MRAFTLLEITITASVIAVVAAVTMPIIGGAVKSKKQAAAATKTELLVNRGRDAAREQLRCVTIAGHVPYHAFGSGGLGAYLHDCNVPAEDWNRDGIPDAAPSVVTIDQIEVHPEVVSGFEILEPGHGCSGTPPALSCYVGRPYENHAYRYSTSGTTDKPYRIRLNNADGTKEHFVVHPATGELRKVDTL